MNSKPELFTEGLIGTKKTANRFVAQPMEANDSINGGKVSERAIERYKQLARGKWGIIIIEAISVTEKSLARINGLILDEDNLNSFKVLVDEIKMINPEAVVLFQITHSGRNSGAAFSLRKSICPNPETGEEVFTTKEIDDILNLFINAAALSEKAGADGIDFKLCHGYFGGEMLRPNNNRDDKWGGSLENRTLFLRKGIGRIKEKCSPGFIIGSRISIYEGIRGGLGTSSPDSIIEDLTEVSEIVKIMNELGMDYINVSAGVPALTSMLTRPEKGSSLLYLNMLRYNNWVSGLLKNMGSDMKVIASAFSILKEEGMAIANENIDNGNADFIGWGRQNFADPLFPAKLKDNQEVNWCKICAGCSKLLRSQEHTGCIQFNDYYKQVFKGIKK
ncbi:MAG: hypothetical protein KAS71_17480 [Bacteroidales bacterium]|nr:hypothetical protein [Bacteroidales bacterium]